MDLSKLKTYLKNCKHPYVIILVGPPLSGKDSVLCELNLDAVMISRDQILLDVYGSDNYDEAFKSVNQKEVDRQLTKMLIDSGMSQSNIIVNMTNLTRKRREHNLSFFKNHFKIALIFPLLTEEEYSLRNFKRKSEEKKFIPENVLKNMISSYQSIDKIEEGFDKVISI
jgi:predicted kinase